MSRLPPWLPLYLLAVVAATGFPFYLHCARVGIDLAGPRPLDLAQNLLLFTPLGFALRERRRGWVVLMALLGSVAIECAQLWLGRSASLWDVICNGLGAAGGHHLRPRHLPSLRRHGPALAALCCVAVIALLRFDATLRAPAGLGAWPAMPLWLGNEASGDRPWRGTLSQLAVFDRAAPAAAAGALPASWRRGGPVLWLDFAGGFRGFLDGPQGRRPLSWQTSDAAALRPEGLLLSGGALRLPDAWADHVRARLLASGQLAVSARLAPASLDQTGPARIASLSGSVEQRSFTLAQSQGDVLFRLATPATGANGDDPETRTHGAPLRLGSQRVDASFDGLAVRIRVGGSCRGEQLLSTARGAGLLGDVLALVIVAVVGLASFAAGQRRPAIATAASATAVTGLAAGAVAFALMRPAWDHLPHFQLTATCLGGLAAVAGWFWSWRRGRAA